VAPAPIKLGATGERADDLQRGVNRVVDNREFDWRKIEVDGAAGPDTFNAAAFAFYLLGGSDEQLRRIRRNGRITQHVFLTLTGEKARSEAMKRREQQRKDDFRALRRRHEQRGTRAGVQITNLSPGEPHLGGADAVLDFVEFFMVRRGLPIGSGKRTPSHNAAIGGSPNSDHLTTKTTTDARDFPTFTGEDDARALAAALGNHNWQPNSFATFDIVVDGHRFRIQILWGSAIFHGDHVHVGVSYLGPA
jgi:hypothetical protein